MFSDEEILKLKQFCQEVINRPRTFDEQPSIRQGKYIWCDDWEIIEICKYIFNGKTAYYGDPPPNRLKNNPLWSKEKIETETEGIIEEYKTMDAIIDLLRKKREYVRA